MTENVIELRQYRDKTTDTIRISGWDLEQAIAEYLLQNGQITNADEVLGLFAIGDDSPGLPILFTDTEFQAIVKREATDGDNTNV
jgi:hypothetical protein